MEHSGAWHPFNVEDRKTYPKINAPVQVRDSDGNRFEGDFLKLVSRTRVFGESPIISWRYPGIGRKSQPESH
jgi:hypothetical protein